VSLQELKERALQDEEVRREYNSIEDDFAMSKIRYAVWGRDRTYKWLWLASLVAGIDAFKQRYKKRTTHDEIKR